MKDIKVFDWQDSHFSGPAIQAGAGVQGFEAIQFAATHGLVAVTGSCPTVGVAGGHIQGGGHSPLASKFGLAADNALEFEVVDGLGNVLIANREEHSDLFWALSGGGGGTYGVVTRVTVKAYEAFPVTTDSLNFPMASISEDVLHGAISSLHIAVSALVDLGISATTIFSSGYLANNLMAPNIPADEVDRILEPLITYLDQNGILYARTVTVYDSYADYFGEASSLDYLHVQGGSWLIPRYGALDPEKDAAYIDAILDVAGTGATVATLGFNVSKAVAGDVDNAVLEAWRQALFYTLVIM